MRRVFLVTAREYRRMAAVQNPYGDGRAAERIVDFVTRLARPRKAAS